MCRFHVRELLLYFYYITVIGHHQGAANRANIYKIPRQNPTQNPMTKVIINDMRAAFYPITNDSRLTENVVTHMYNFKLLNSNKHATMMFKLPVNEIEQDNRQAERTLFMERLQFMEPKFPNLTDSYMTLRRFKFSKAPINEHISKLMKKEMQEIEQQPLNDPWSHLGLNGWDGDIADPFNVTQSVPSKIGNEYPHIEITKDLYGGISSTEYFKDIEQKEKRQREEFMKEMDTNVFIARANDPFGYSTKWQLRKSNQTKHKRDVLRLYSMLQCSTGCEPLIYKGYGCYCGFLGNGIPTDGIDRCCKIHDKCYEQSNCPSYLEYFVPYVWKCYRGKPLCAIDHGEWGGPDSCAARLCYCDLRLSRCLREFSCPQKRAVCRSSLSRRLQNILFVK
ncbi:uncharacterized protein LOC106083384 [Stomoxys calcitrans]|uniref:Phospholipase A2 n=1 Tax=Stomoxys calcitrans TaxID=35570 RepID=A0A1I8Q7A7_STOCA|nr:uncharacterized protein LOC106083384 [Stomoxys calcitrans]